MCGRGYVPRKKLHYTPKTETLLLVDIKKKIEKAGETTSKRAITYILFQ